MVSAMSLLLKFACVVVFVAVMVALHQGFLSLRYFFSGDFPVGFIAGFWFAIALVFLIRKLEPSK